MRKFSVFLILAMLFGMFSNISAQNYNFLKKFEIQILGYNEIFYSSDLSILENNPQKIFLSNNSVATNLKYMILSATDSETSNGISLFAGINYSNSPLKISSLEKINLSSLGFMSGFGMQWKKNFSMDFYFDVDFARYKNEFTYKSVDYEYTKNGLKAALSSTFYCSVMEYCRIGLGLKYNTYIFNNNKEVKSTKLQLPKNARMSSLMPFITFTCIL